MKLKLVFKKKYDIHYEMNVNIFLNLVTNLKNSVDLLNGVELGLDQLGGSEALGGVLVLRFVCFLVVWGIGKKERKKDVDYDFFKKKKKGKQDVDYDIKEPRRGSALFVSYKKTWNAHICTERKVQTERVSESECVWVYVCMYVCA